MAAREILESFTVRIAREDGIDMPSFDEIVKERGISREEMVRQLMQAFLAHQKEEEEEYYTIKGYSPDHRRAADISKYGRQDVWLHRTGFDDAADGAVWMTFEHARDLVERGGSGDKEEAIALFKSIFGERNVFLKKEN